MLTQSVQEYLKAIYMLRERGRAVTTGRIAQRLGVAHASAANMVKRLAQQRLVSHDPYHTVELTAAGRAALSR